MKPGGYLFLPLLLTVLAPAATAQTVRFPLPPTTRPLSSPLRPGTFFDVVGRQAALFGREEGRSEAWVFPFQLVRDVKLLYRFPGMPAPDDLSYFASKIEVLPERTTISYSHPLFTLRQHIIAPVEEQALLLLLEIDASKDVALLVSFLPSLQPMWPAGLGGQYAYWEAGEHAYVISESRRRFNAMIGSPGSRKMSPPLAHELSQKPLLFALPVNADSCRRVFYPVIITADFRGRDACVQKYRRLLRSIPALYAATRQHYADFLRSSLRLSGTEFDRPLMWNQLALHRGFVRNPDLGSGLVAGFGPSGASRRPGFAWFFGGDACMNSYALLAGGDHAIVRESLRLLQKYQRADGKIMHELSQSGGLLDWFGDFPYAYIHGDTTPFYLAAMENDYRHTGDSAFVRESRDSIIRAFQWCRATDSDGDGLMENTLAGLGASELGSLRESTGVDIYLAAIGVQAWKSFAALAPLAGAGDTLAKQAQALHRRGRARLHSKFWNPEKKIYNFSITRSGKPNPEVTAWMAFPIAFGLLPAAQARQALVEVASADICTDWGSRMLSARSAAYDPLAYNNGAVWPFLTGFVIRALYAQHNAEAGLQNLRNLAPWVVRDAPGAMPEILSGAYARPLQTSVPHQLFSSSGFVTGLVHGLLGLEWNAATRTLRVAPQVPPDWTEFTLENVVIAGDTLAFRVVQNERLQKITLLRRPEKPVRIEWISTFGPFARLDETTTTPGFEPARQAGARAVRFRIQFSTADRREVQIGANDPFRFWLPAAKTETGDPPQQMKLLDFGRQSAHELMLLLEAPGGTTQTLRYRGRATAGSTAGLQLTRDKILVDFAGRGYVRKKIVLHVNE